MQRVLNSLMSINYLHSHFFLQSQSSDSLITSHHMEEFIILFADDQLPSKAYVIAPVPVQRAFRSPPHTHRAETEDLARENSCIMDSYIMGYSHLAIISRNITPTRLQFHHPRIYITLWPHLPAILTHLHRVPALVTYLALPVPA